MTRNKSGTLLSAENSCPACEIYHDAIWHFPSLLLWFNGSWRNYIHLSCSSSSWPFCQGLSQQQKSNLKTKTGSWTKYNHTKRLATKSNPVLILSCNINTGDNQSEQSLLSKWRDIQRSSNDPIIAIDSRINSFINFRLALHPTIKKKREKVTNSKYYHIVRVTQRESDGKQQYIN